MRIWSYIPQPDRGEEDEYGEEEDDDDEDEYGEEKDVYINTVDLIAWPKYGGQQSFGRRLEHCGRVDPAEWREPCRTSFAFRSTALHEHCTRRLRDTSRDPRPPGDGLELRAVRE